MHDRHSNPCCFVEATGLWPQLFCIRRFGGRKMTQHLQKQAKVPVRRSKRQKTCIVRYTSTSDSSSSSEEHETDGADSDFDPTSGSTAFLEDEDVLPQTYTVARKRSSLKKTPSLKETHHDLRQVDSSCHDSRTAFTAKELTFLRSSLLDWYVDNHRKLPWRPFPRYQKDGLPTHPLALPESQSSPGAPYAIWISEVMSQQTRIQVVVEYYNRWMREFPTVHHLARASLDRVNELWAGLGYYRRARFLHEGAKQIVDKHDGNLPADAASLQKLKGIGRYTAGAISSIAFGQAQPAVDGNVERVLSRLRPALTEDENASKDLSRKYWSLASSCVHGVASPGDFNQAMMELGATVCKPKNVECGVCPLQSICGAYRAATRLDIEDPCEFVTRYPVKDPRKRTKVREESVMVLVVWAYIDGMQMFLTLQRPKEGLLASLWEAPNKVMQSSQPNAEVTALGELLDLLPEVAGVDDVISRDSCVEVGNVLHIFSHIRQTLDVRVLQLSQGLFTDIKQGTTSAAVPFRWLSREDMEGSALSTQMRKVFALAIRRLEGADKR